jgi:diguanylate cyclase (GGDEF)-like protein/PAS domain S-box-containing protein
MDNLSVQRMRRSRTLGVLLAVFLMAGGLGYLVVKDAVTNTVEHQALAIAEIVANQATTARSVYSHDVAEKLVEERVVTLLAQMPATDAIPIPSKFLKLVGQATSAQSNKLYEYKPISRWNLEPSQGLGDDFLRWAWPQLEKQDRAKPAAPIAWQAVSRFEQQDGQRVLRYLTADPASQQACVACHNSFEKSPDVVAMRVASGVPEGKQWAQHQLLGALSITVPLDRAEQVAGIEIRRASVFIFAILVTSFLAMAWFNTRLAKRETSLREAALRLENAQREMQSAQALLEAKQGVEAALAELSSYMQAIDQHAMVSVADGMGRILQVNDKLLALSGYAQHELLDHDHRMLNSGSHGAAFWQQFWLTIRAGDTWRGVICNRNKAGDLYWVDAAVVPLKDGNGQVARFISICIDITERKLSEQSMLHVATHDVLTGLANRRLLRERMLKALSDGRRSSALAAVLFIDLDAFKVINDSLGHDVGDALLVEASQRLRTCVRSDDTVARQGGDEFIVFMPQLESAHGPATLADKLLAALSQPFHVDGRVLRIGCSIGIAVYPVDGEDVDSLLKHSDTAMYRAKKEGRNGYRFYASAMDAEDSRM